MTADIRDIKVPVEFPLMWVLLGAGLCIAAGLMYFFILRRKSAAALPVIVPKRPAWEIALQGLDELSRKNYPQTGNYKQFYITLSGIIRHYLENRFNIKAPEMTTEEFLNHMKTTTALSDDQKRALKNFLNGCDMVKFAKYTPSVNDAQANFDLAKRLIMETKGTDGI